MDKGMRRAIGPVVASLLFACSSAAQLKEQTAKTESIEELVYRLVDPTGRLVVQERLLDAGIEAVPLLMRSIMDRDCKLAGRSIA